MPLQPLPAPAARLHVGFEGPVPSDEIKALIRRGVGGVVLFGRNVTADPRQVKALTNDLKRLAAEFGRTLVVSIDQEGGAVRRLRSDPDGAPNGPFTAVPSMRAVGRTGDPAVARLAGRVLGRECRAVGIDLDFAPILDVDTNPANPVIADRSFGPDPDLVAAMGIEVCRGLRDAGVGTCGKHFPGHGDTSQDSHHALPALDHDLPRLDAVELAPFAAAARAGVLDAVMTAHILFPALDGTYPATMSGAVMRGLLRDRIGFDGPAVSDDLEMAGVAADYEVEEIVRRGSAAGVDVLLVCHTPDLQHRALDALLALPASDHAEALRRVAALSALARPADDADPRDSLDDPAHRDEVRRLLDACGRAADVADPTAFR